MDQTTKQELIARYRDGHRVVMDAVAGLTDTELDTRGEPGEWTPRQIIHHLADSEMTSAIRLRRLLAENRPEIQRYDEEAFAARLHYDRPIGASLDALKAVRASSAELLDRLSETDWLREGTHTQSGRYTVEDWLTIYATHAHDHADQIQRAQGGSSKVS